MRIRLFQILFFATLFFTSCSTEDKVAAKSENYVKPDLSTLYTRAYRFIDLKEYNLAFSDLAFYLRFFSLNELLDFDMQNLFAKYIIEGEDSLENIVDNYSRLFDFFSSADAEAIYQMLMYRSHNESDIERIALIVASKVDANRVEAGLYFFLAYTFFQLKIRDQANRYLDCLIDIAPYHRATSYLAFRIRGKKPFYRLESTESLKNLFYKENTPDVSSTVAMNFHIPSMINKEWEDIGRMLLDHQNYETKIIAYSEIPIFFAKNGDGERLYLYLKNQIINNDYKLFSLVARSLLYVYKEPHTIIDRLKREFAEHPFVMALTAKYLLSLSHDNINDAAQLYLNALERDNNVEIFNEALDVFSRTSDIFKLKSFAEELLFKYPYNVELYNVYKIISSNINDDFFSRYFEHIPDSPNKYLILSYIVSQPETKRRYLLDGLKVYREDCSIILELLKLYSNYNNDDFAIAYNKYLKDYIGRDDFYRCIKFIKGN